MTANRHSTIGRIIRQDWPKILVGVPLCFTFFMVLLGFGPLLLETMGVQNVEVTVRAFNVEDAANLWAAVENFWSRP